MPIDFTCPYCGTQTQVDDQYLGQTGPCASCGRTITIPSATFSAYAPPPSRGKTSSVIVILVICFGGLVVLGMFAGLLLPAIQAAREAARRMECSNNLKRIGLAMQMYHAEYDSFPPPYTVDDRGQPLHSWRVLLLPYLEHQVLYSQIHLDEPWDSPHNRQFASLIPPVYRCPSSPYELESGTTDYLMITGPGTIGEGPQGTKREEIQDGLSNTLCVTETAGSETNWMEPSDLDDIMMEIKIDSPGIRLFGGAISSYHPGVANVLFCDGSVQSLSIHTDPKVIEAMFTKSGGEQAELYSD